MEDITNKIHTFLLEELDAGLDGDSFNNQTPLFGFHGVIESMAILDVVSFLEETFQITVAAHEITEDNFGSVDYLASYISSKG